MAESNPKAPLRADHRFIKRLIGVVLEGKVEQVPEEYDRVARVFRKAGGSWQRLFRGSPEEINRLKKVLDVAYDKGYMTKKHKWGDGG